MNTYRLRLILSFMKGNLKLYIIAVASMVTNIAIDLLTPLFLSFIIDFVFKGEAASIPLWLSGAFLALGDREWYLHNLWMLGVLLVLINLLSGAFMYCRSYFSARASENIAFNIRSRLYERLSRWTYNDHVKAETGDLIQRCSSDVETVRRFLSNQFIEMGRAVVLLTLALCVLIPLSGRLTALSVMLTPFIFVFSMSFFRLVKRYFKDADEAEGALSATLQENLTGVRVVRAFGRQRFEVDKFEQKNATYRDKNRRVINVMSIFWSSSDMMSGLQIALTLGFAGYMGATGQLSAGTVIVFMMYVGKLLWPVRQLGRILADMGKAFVSIGRIDEVLKKEGETDEDGTLEPPINGEIVFDNVNFSYDENHPILRDVSFTVKPGQTVAILGATGSGKSTIMLLLQRLYDVTSGSLTIGGVDIRDIKKKHLRERVGIVLQEPFLFSKTIRENVAIARVNPTEDEVLDATRTAHADGFIRDFEKGYDTVVGERGVTLSGGQKQRVAIARTLMKRSDILIFDDSLSAVDTETDAAIRRELKKKRAGVTTFIVSHRVLTLQEADFILVLEDGRITQKGPHAELVKQDGLYRRIYDIQTSLESDVESELVG